MIGLDDAVKAAKEAAGAVVGGDGYEPPRVLKVDVPEEVRKHLADKDAYPCSVLGDRATFEAIKRILPSKVSAIASMLGLGSGGDDVLGAIQAMQGAASLALGEGGPELGGEAAELRPICIRTLVYGKEACKCPEPEVEEVELLPETEEIEAVLKRKPVPFLVMTGMDAAFLSYIVELGGVYSRKGFITSGVAEGRAKAAYLYLRSKEYLGYADGKGAPTGLNLFGVGGADRLEDHYHWQNVRAMEAFMSSEGFGTDEVEIGERLDDRGFRSYLEQAAGLLGEIDPFDTSMLDSALSLMDGLEEVVSKAMDLNLGVDIPFARVKGMVSVPKAVGGLDLSAAAARLGIKATAFDGAGDYFLDALKSGAFAVTNMIGWAVRVLNWFIELVSSIFNDKGFFDTFQTFPEPDLGQNDLGIFLSMVALDIVYHWLFVPLCTWSWKDMDFSRIGKNFVRFADVWLPPIGDATWDALKGRYGPLGALLRYGHHAGAAEGEEVSADAFGAIFDFLWFTFLGYYSMRYLSTSTSVGGNLAGMGRTLLTCFAITIFHNFIAKGVLREVAFNHNWVCLFGSIFGMFTFEMFKLCGAWANLFIVAMIGCVLGFAWKALDAGDIVGLSFLGIMVMAYMSSNVGEFGKMALDEWKEEVDAELARKENYRGIRFLLEGGQPVHGIELLLELAEAPPPAGKDEKGTGDETDGKPPSGAPASEPRAFETSSFLIVDGYLPKTSDDGTETKVPVGKYNVYLTKRNKDGTEVPLTDPDPPAKLVDRIDVPKTEAEQETPFEIRLPWKNYLRVKAPNLGGLPDLVGIADQSEAYDITERSPHIFTDLPNPVLAHRNHVVEEDGSHVFVLPDLPESTAGSPRPLRVFGAVDGSGGGPTTNQQWLMERAVITVRDVAYTPSDPSSPYHDPVIMVKLRHRYDLSKLESEPPSKAFLAGDVPVVTQNRGNCGAFSSGQCFTFWKPYAYNPWSSPDGLLKDDHDIHLFWLSGSAKAELNIGKIPAEILTKFQSMNKYLSPTASVATVDETHWRITDGDWTYNIEERSGSLLVSSRPNPNSGGLYCDAHCPGEVMWAYLSDSYQKGGRYPEGLAQLHKSEGFKSKVIVADRRDKAGAMKALKRYIAANIPVIVLVEEYAGDFNSKHYKTLVGYDDDREVRGILAEVGDDVRIEQLKAGYLADQKGAFSIAAGTMAKVVVVDEAHWRVRITVPGLTMEGGEEDTFEVQPDEIAVDGGGAPEAGKRAKVVSLAEGSLASSDYDVQVGAKGEITGTSPLTIRLEVPAPHKRGVKTKRIKAKVSELMDTSSKGPPEVGRKAVVTAHMTGSLADSAYYVPIGYEGKVLSITGTDVELEMDTEVDRCFTAHPDELSKGGRPIASVHKGVFYFTNTGAKMESAHHKPPDPHHVEDASRADWKILPIGNDMDPQDTFWEKWKEGGLASGVLGQSKDCTYIPVAMDPPKGD